MIINLAFFIATIAIISIIIMLLGRLRTISFKINKKNYPSRLTVCDTIVIDRTRHLVVVRWDNTEHLLLIGGETDIVVESNTIGTPSVTHKSIDKLKKNTQSTNIETDRNHNSTKKASLLVPEEKHTDNDTSAFFVNQYLEDSAITAKIEGRQEPSLSIPLPPK
ncbi:flagellar biosynthetic protein FliO [Bartonella sp. B30(2025)]